MNFWIYRDHRQQGPFTFEQLQAMQLKPDTPVWYEGLSKWIPASEAPLTKPLFVTDEAEKQSDYVSYTETTQNDQETEQASCQPTAQSVESYNNTPSAQVYSQTSEQTQMPSEPCPPTHLAWAIISTLCCCTPLGIVAIIFSSQVKVKYQRGNLAGAIKSSDTSAWLIMLSITLGLLMLPLSLALYS